MNQHLSQPQDMVALPGAALDALMPMHIRFDQNGRVLRVGPTLKKLHGAVQNDSDTVLDYVVLRRPSGGDTVGGLLALEGQRLSLHLRSRPGLALRGQCLALPNGGGGILNISLGLSFAEAVEECGLTLSDFSHCDQTVDLLYLSEAVRSVSEASRNLTDRLVASETAARARAASDELTGLANRRALTAFLDRLSQRFDQPFGIIQIDLDHFKEINDEMGHAAGDAVLQHVAKILLAAVRDEDMAVRMGGDEFALVIRGTDEPAMLHAIAERILSDVKLPLEIEGQFVEIGASIGSTRSSFYAKPDPSQMLRDADEALYASKRSGRGQHCIFRMPGPDDRIIP
ncbi:MAG: GGDEF domain-containing protein [Pseudomonadota bacterium]